MRTLIIIDVQAVNVTILVNEHAKGTQGQLINCSKIFNTSYVRLTIGYNECL